VTKKNAWKPPPGVFSLVLGCEFRPPEAALFTRAVPGGLKSLEQGWNVMVLRYPTAGSPASTFLPRFPLLPRHLLGLPLGHWFLFGAVCNRWSQLGLNDGRTMRLKGEK